MDNADNTLRALQDFLSGPDAKDKINEALSMLSSSDLSSFGIADTVQEKNTHDSQADNKAPLNDLSGFDMPDINPAKLLKIMADFKKADSGSDPRSNLISALKPYLKQDKQRRADKAIKIVKFLKFAPMLENLKDIFN